MQDFEILHVDCLGCDMILVQQNLVAHEVICQPYRGCLVEDWAAPYRLQRREDFPFESLAMPQAA